MCVTAAQAQRNRWARHGATFRENLFQTRIGSFPKGMGLDPGDCFIGMDLEITEQLPHDTT